MLTKKQIEKVMNGEGNIRCSGNMCAYHESCDGLYVFKDLVSGIFANFAEGDLLTNPDINFCPLLKDVEIDPFDYGSLILLMDQYGDLGYALMSENDDGEFTWASIGKDRIDVETLQSNGWTRVNIYHRDGTTEELYKKD